MRASTVWAGEAARSLLRGLLTRQGCLPALGGRSTGAKGITNTHTHTAHAPDGGLTRTHPVHTSQRRRGSKGGHKKNKNGQQGPASQLASPAILQPHARGGTHCIRSHARCTLCITKRTTPPDSAHPIRPPSPPLPAGISISRHCRPHAQAHLHVGGQLHDVAKDGDARVRQASPAGHLHYERGLALLQQVPERSTEGVPLFSHGPLLSKLVVHLRHRRTMLHMRHGCRAHPGSRVRAEGCSVVHGVRRRYAQHAVGS